MKSSKEQKSLHLLKVLLPPQLAQLGPLFLHILGTCVLSIGLNLALDGWVEGAQYPSSQEGRVDAVVDANCRDGDACSSTVSFTEENIKSMWFQTYLVAFAQCYIGCQRRRASCP